MCIRDRKYDEYFKRSNHVNQLLRPFELIEQSTSYDVRCSVKGGGHSGQVGAMIHGISKALLLFDASFKAPLKKEKLTTRDSRSVERKNTVIEKQEEAFSFLKDNYFFTINCYNNLWTNLTY